MSLLTKPMYMSVLTKLIIKDLVNIGKSFVHFNGCSPDFVNTVKSLLTK